MYIYVRITYVLNMYCCQPSSSAAAVADRLAALPRCAAAVAVCDGRIEFLGTRRRRRRGDI